MTHRLLLPTLISFAISGGLCPTSLAAPDVSVLVAKKEEKPPDALVTEVQIRKENLANTCFYTLQGSLKNQSDATILTPLIHYEIYSEASDKLVDAGTAVIEPKVLPAGQVGAFEQDLNTDGKIRITLVEWQQEDKAVKSHKQLQFFPLEPQPSDGTTAPAN